MPNKFERIQLYGKIRENINREKAVANHVFPVSRDGKFFTLDEQLRLYTVYIKNSKKLLRCCLVDMTDKGGCVSTVLCSTCVFFITASL
jgi:hypothetical protein